MNENTRHDEQNNTADSSLRNPHITALTNSELKRTRFRSYALIVLAAFWMTAGLAIVVAMILNETNNTPTSALFPVFALSLVTGSIGLLVRARFFQWLGVFVCLGMMTRPPYGIVIGLIGVYLLLTNTKLFGRSKLSHQELEDEHTDRQSKAIPNEDTSES